jgi:hypothetical protein
LKPGITKDNLTLIPLIELILRKKKHSREEVCDWSEFLNLPLLKYPLAFIGTL